MLENDISHLKLLYLTPSLIDSRCNLNPSVCVFSNYLLLTNTEVEKVVCITE